MDQNEHSHNTRIYGNYAIRGSVADIRTRQSDTLSAPPKSRLSPRIVFACLIVGTLLLGGIVCALIVSAGLHQTKESPRTPTLSTNTSYRLGVLVIKYFPIASDGQHIDINVTGDVGGLYSDVRQHTIDVTNNLLEFLPRASQYLGSKYPANAESLHYYIVDTKEHTEAVPIKAHGDRVTYPDYNYVMSRENICDYVDSHNVHEVWFWAYQGPNQPSKNNQPYLGIDETKMSSKYGDVSNSYEYNDMPICQHTYTVYTFNFQRGTAEAMHSWGHQLEAEFKYVDSNLFGLFQGPDHPQTLGMTGRCGWVHNPPNAREDYDYDNPTPQASDCDDWQPDGLGATAQISCAVWGCGYRSDTDNSQLNYFVWMWQHLPGMNNTKTYQGKQLRNWWDVHGNYDTVVGSEKRLTI